ncbi:hypothetical protein CYMTET_2931 [Cymbomonas tetramitiformis]|uniref:Uncharacterized protein n=1 Tax=Cymbomonas tetramitiformis TaxID=36881 RepID=A0AAE0H4E9_9CHLO|nr:hypothetical protein CYMTET_2931 [Cymbomonas tetramitiformis]
MTRDTRGLRGTRIPVKANGLPECDDMSAVSLRRMFFFFVARDYNILIPRTQEYYYHDEETDYDRLDAEREDDLEASDNDDDNDDDVDCDELTSAMTGGGPSCSPPHVVCDSEIEFVLRMRGDRTEYRVDGDALVDMIINQNSEIGEAMRNEILGRAHVKHIQTRVISGDRSELSDLHLDVCTDTNSNEDKDRRCVLTDEFHVFGASTDHDSSICRRRMPLALAFDNVTTVYKNRIARVEMKNPLNYVDLTLLADENDVAAGHISHEGRSLCDGATFAHVIKREYTQHNDRMTHAIIGKTSAETLRMIQYALNHMPRKERREGGRVRCSWDTWLQDATFDTDFGLVKYLDWNLYLKVKLWYCKNQSRFGGILQKLDRGIIIRVRSMDDDDDVFGGARGALKMNMQIQIETRESRSGERRRLGAPSAPDADDDSENDEY